VVGSVRHFALETEPRPETYAPVGANPLFSPIFTIRTAGDPAAVLPLLTAAVRAANAECPVYNVFRMEDLVARSAGQRRFVVILLAVFAGLALALAAVGVYGIVAQSVAQRTAEIGLRMALGSTPAGALGLVFGDGLKLTLVGVVAGLAGAVGMARAMKSLLFAVQPLDPIAFGLAAVVLVALASAACLIPAWRATRIDTVVALRSE
jgi:putative ABC transport system permease protein